MTITDCVTSLKVQGLFLILVTFINSPSRAADSYGAFSNFTLGSSRVLGLGGAYTALSGDSNAFLYNPAGVVTSPSDFHFDASTNRLINNELDPKLSSPTTENVPKQYDLIGAHARLGRISIGLGYVVPYFFEIKDPWLMRQHSLRIQEVGLNLSYSLSKNWSVGINGKYSEASQKEVAPLISNEMSSNINYVQWGILFQKNRLALGYSFSPELIWTKTNSLSNSFLDAKSPQRQVLGFSYFVKPDKIRLSIDFVSLQKLTDSIGYESVENFNPEPIQEIDFQFPKVGLEFTLLKNRRTNAQFRVGYYDEPSRFKSVSNRAHFTIGFEVSIGPALLQVAQDQATNFNNTSQSFSIVFGKL